MFVPHGRRRSTPALARLAVLVVTACASPRAATQVTVLVEAQPHVRGVATQLVVRVTGGHEGETFLDAGEPIVRDAPLAWPFDVTVTPAGADATRLFEVEATAYDAGHQLVSQARLRGGYVRGNARRVTLTLEDACVGISCPTGLACRDGRCVQIGPTDDDAGVRDGGGDAGPTRCGANAECDDDNVCNGFETCVAGACVPGARLDCDDHVACTSDSCDGRQCVHTPEASRCTRDVGGTCDPVNDCQYPSCTAANCVTTGCQTARCNGSVCERTFACGAGQSCCGSACVPMGCEDGLPCTTDYCGAAGSCQHDVHAGPCDDRDLCTGDGTCASDGSCTGGARMSCDDGNGCTTDTCDPARGCVSSANALPCSDDNPCTLNDSCGGSACVPGVMDLCDDGIACTRDMCDRTRGCAHAPDDTLCTGAGAHCSATAGCQVTGTCTSANCQPTPGTCETAACSTDLTMCIRASSCTTGQMCCGTQCVPEACSDGNVCTDDACMPASSTCSHTPSTRGCDDGDPCTTSDACSGTTCTGTPLSCDDLNQCTDDVCSGGTCSHSFNGGPCVPVSECAGDGICIGGYCRPGTLCPGATICCGGICELPASC